MIMLDTAITSLNGLPAFAAYFALAVVLLLLFVRLYTWVTPHDEFGLIRANNAAAAIAFSGAVLGFAWPLASAITHSMSLLDCAIWGAIALLVQILTFVLSSSALKQLPQRITQGELAAGIFSAACSVSVGMLNAASMSY
jgi:putative membrane protein